MLIAVLSSLGLPGLNNFAGEFLALLGAFSRSALFGTLGTIVVVPAAWYFIRFFLGTMEGPAQREGAVAASLRKGVLSDISLGEFVPLLPLLALIFYIGVQPLPLTTLLEPSVANTLNFLGSAFTR
jgi:NADH-quinone oxidoreductase subunit M